MAIAAKCLEATLSQTEEDEAERIKGVGGFNYLGILMYWSETDWPKVLHHTRKASQVWGRLGKLLQREGFGAEISGTLVWSGDMSAQGDNVSEVRGIACDFLEAYHT